jgi:hypothetical protein
MTKINLLDLVEEYVKFIRETAIKHPDRLDAISDISNWADCNGLYCQELVQHDKHDIYNLGGEAED